MTVGPISDAVDRIDAEAVNSKEKRSLYKKRVKIFPKRATGTFRTLKWWVMLVTLYIYYVTPWLRWDRGPYAPDQAVLVDLANRRFYFFAVEIWPHEFIYIAGLLIMAGIGLFLVTSTVGRAWCGYTCPQTVWVDLFLVVERWIEGDRNARIKLDKAPWDFAKLRKRLAKHIIWLMIAMATGGAWIFYFADAPTLAQNFLSFQAPFIAYSTVAVLTATTYVFAGFMREQICTYMCPWPRIQAAMLDEDSLVVTYNDYRGEPRSRHKKKQNQLETPIGDCVDCNQCVAVCPMGIDIRDGQQLECITCALCIDACDSVMEKVGKPRGLISYATLTDYNHSAAGQPVTTTFSSFIRLRTFIYSGLWALIGLAIVAALVTRDRLDMSVLHDRNPVFVRLSDGSIRNGFTIKILNMEARPRLFTVRIDGLPGAIIAQAGLSASLTGQLFVDVGPDQLRQIKVYVTRPKTAVSSARTAFDFLVADRNGSEQARQETAFHAPDGS